MKLFLYANCLYNSRKFAVFFAHLVAYLSNELSSRIKNRYQHFFEISKNKLDEFFSKTPVWRPWNDNFRIISGWVFHGFLIRVQPSDSCGFSYIAYSYSSILLIRLQKFFRKIDFSPKSGKKPKISFPTIFSKMTFLNIFHRILVKKIHFGRFGQVSGG